MNKRLADEKAESHRLEREALQLGIDIPKNPDWWANDADDYSGPIDQMEYAINYWLTAIGRSGTSRLIQDERTRLEEVRRKDVEWQRKATQWKLTVIGTIIGWIMGILGLLIAIIALLRKPPTH